MGGELDSSQILLRCNVQENCSSCSANVQSNNTVKTTFVSSFFEGASSFVRCCSLLVFSFFVLRGEGVASFRTWFLVFVFLFVAERLLNSVPYWTTIG